MREKVRRLHALRAGSRSIARAGSRLGASIGRLFRLWRGRYRESTGAGEAVGFAFGRNGKNNLTTNPPTGEFPASFRMRQNL